MIPLGQNDPYVQTFDTGTSVNGPGLADNGTSSDLPSGWAFVESGDSANATYIAAAGQGFAPPSDTYSYGGGPSNDRAFGTYSGSSDSFWSSIGANFVNSSGSAINRITVAYVGEEWRLGANDRTDRLDFQYSLDATSLTTGTWIDLNNLDFVTPWTKGNTGGTDGNQRKYQTAVSGSVSFLNIPIGAGFWIRWTDLNISGVDDGLAVDDFSIVAVPEASTVFAGLALLSVFCFDLARRRSAELVRRLNTRIQH